MLLSKFDFLHFKARSSLRPADSFFLSSCIVSSVKLPKTKQKGNGLLPHLYIPPTTTATHHNTFILWFLHKIGRTREMRERKKEDKIRIIRSF